MSSYLILHGLGGSLNGHWQEWLNERLKAKGERTFFPQLPDWDSPSKEIWLRTLNKVMDTIPEGDFLTVVAHSLGCALWIHYVAQSHRRRADRVILVSPPSQWLSAETVDTHFPNADGRRMLRSFFPLPDDRTSLAKASDKTLFVISSNDPFLPPDQVHHYFDYDVPVMIIPGCGHINVGTGFGAWPSMLELCLNDAFPFPVVHPASSGHS